MTTKEYLGTLMAVLTINGTIVDKGIVIRISGSSKMWIESSHQKKHLHQQKQYLRMRRI